MSGGGGDGRVGVVVGVEVGVDEGVGVRVGVRLGVTVGVGVGVGEVPLNEDTTSPADAPTRFHVATIWLWVPELLNTEMLVGAPVELTEVGDDHTV